LCASGGIRLLDFFPTRRASDLEFPDLDVSLRGAVSIARRLQDPLAELVKIDPKSIGVGQYQHDVNQRALARQLDAMVEDCVNARSEEHTSELQSRENLVCRLLL